MAEEQVIETLRLDMKINKNFSIDDLKALSSRINSLSNSIKKLNEIPAIGANSALSIFLQKLSESLQSLDTAKINDLAKSFRGLSSISSLTKLENVDWNAISQGFKKLAVDIEPFLLKVKDAEQSLVALNGVLSKSTGRKIGTALKTSAEQTVSKNLNYAAILSSMTRIYYIGTKIGRVIENISQSGMDYQETLNLWTVAMRGHNEVATEFLNKMSDAYGISEQTLMKAQATFKNMIGSLGQISPKDAYILSESITQMALDYASLYNVSIEQAMTKFQAALAGQVRPIRTESGLDITESTLFQFYKELGGEKTVRQLNRTEKQLLAILAVYRQMEAAGALGDMANTINNAANQSRVMAETWSDIKDYVGAMFVYLLNENKVLIKINAGLMLAADFLKSFAQGMGALENQNANADLSDALDGIAGDAEGATEEVEKLKNALFGFDKFQVLSQGTGDSGLGLNISEEIKEAFKGYSNFTGKLEHEARNLADKWLDILGYTKDSSGAIKDAEGNAIKLKDVFDDINDKLLPKTHSIILTIGASIASIAATVALMSSLNSKSITVVKTMEKLKFAFMEVATTTKNTAGNVTALGKAFEFLMKHPIVLVIVAIAAALIYLYQNNEEFRESVNNLLKTLEPFVALLSDLLTDVFEPMKPILDDIVNLLGGVLGDAIRELLPVVRQLNLLLIPVAFIIEFVTKRIQLCALAVDALINKDWSKFKKELTNWSSVDFAASTWNAAISDSDITQYAMQQVGSRAYLGPSDIESSVARGTMIGMSAMDSGSSQTPIDVNVSVDGQSLFQIFRGVAQRNGYDVVEVR